MTEETKQTEINPKENVPNPEITQKMESCDVAENAQMTAPVVTEGDQRTWCMLCHLSALASLVGVPPVIGPLVVWLIKKEQIPMVDKYGKESVNFQLSILLYSIVSIFLCVILIGFLLLPALGILWLVCTIIASVKASNGEFFRYPLTIRFLK